MSIKQSQELANKLLSKIEAQNRGQWQQDIQQAINITYDLPNSAVQSPPTPISPSLHGILTAQEVAAFKSDILQSLDPRYSNARYESIPNPCKDTFEWIFDPDADWQNWADYVEWLRDDAALYWITGKAGSGKSTLMKFICDDTRTVQYLRGKNDTTEVVLLSFYFWNSGPRYQMSQEGLLQTLLHQALSRDPELVPRVFANRLEFHRYFKVYYTWQDTWSWQELASAFRKLVKEITKSKKLAVFIDGLDEYAGKHDELVRFLESCIKPGVKICVSSRPWTIFEDAFRTRPSLRLEYLTERDMRIYVSSKLDSSPGFKVFQELDPDGASNLVGNVITKASGVFLWVYLVTQSLLEGLSEGERLSDLQSRLESLPEDLEQLFWKILNSLGGKHFQGAAQFFQLHLESAVPLTLLDLSYADEEEPEYVFKLSTEVVPLRKLGLRAETARRRLNACTRGLLEPAPQYSRTPPSQESFADPRFVFSTLNYLHGTVREFIHRPKILDSLAEFAKPSFNVHQRLAQAHVAVIKATENDGRFSYFPSPVADDFVVHVVEALDHATKADPLCGEFQIRLLDELDSAANQRWCAMQNRKHRYWTSLLPPFEECSSMLQLAVKAQLIQYARYKLEKFASEATECKLLLSTLLYLATTPVDLDSWRTNSFNPRYHTFLSFGRPAGKDMIEYLLDKGADFNVKIRNLECQGIDCSLRGPDEKRKEEGKGEKTIWEEVVSGKWRDPLIVDTFLKHGASPDVTGPNTMDDEDGMADGRDTWILDSLAEASKSRSLKASAAKTTETSPGDASVGLTGAADLSAQIMNMSETQTPKTSDAKTTQASPGDANVGRTRVAHGPLSWARKLLPSFKRRDGPI
jgi:NACHT domain